MSTPHDAQILSSTLEEGPAEDITYTVRIRIGLGEEDVSGVIPFGPRPTAYDIVAAPTGTRYTAFLDDLGRWRHHFVELPAPTECEA